MLAVVYQHLHHIGRRTLAVDAPTSRANELEGPFIPGERSLCINYLEQFTHTTQPPHVLLGLLPHQTTHSQLSASQITAPNQRPR